VTGYPSYPAYPAGAPPQLAEPLPVQVAVAEPARQRRATVAFRLILAIPHLFLLIFLSIAAWVVIFLGWWGALFTGRLPQFAVNYVTGYVTWYLRVLAYLYLLTDAYPPFTLDEVPAYPVRLAVPPPQRLNRAAVFFRVILMIPAGIVASVAAQGVGSIVLFIGWLITLASGRMPAAMHQALTAVLRYQFRFYCYYWLLTPAYPSALFGDAPDGSFAAGGAGYPAPDAGYGPPAPGYGAASGYGAAPGYGAPAGYGPGPGYGAGPGYGGAPGYGPPGYGAPGYGTPGSVYGAPPGYGAPGGYGAPAGYGPGHTVLEPANWRLILTPAAKRMVVVFLVVGAISSIVSTARYGVAVADAVKRAQNVTTANNAINTLNTSYSTLTSEMNRWQDTVTACDQNLTCVTKADTTASTYFSDFATEVRITPVPSDAAAAANQLYSGAMQVARDYAQLGQAANVEQYQSTFNRLGLQLSLNRFDQDFNALGTALNNT
jgi:hypothetical protein